MGVNHLILLGFVFFLWLVSVYQYCILSFSTLQISLKIQIQTQLTRTRLGLLSNFIFRPSDAFPLMIILKPFKRRMRYMALTKRPYMILEWPLVLEIRTTTAIPQLPTILLMSPPVPFHCECFRTFSAHKRLSPMLSFVMGLECSEILQWLCPRVVDVVFAALSTAVAR